MKANEQYFPVVLSLLSSKVILILCLNETKKRKHPKQRLLVLFVYFVVYILHREFTILFLSFSV